MKKKRTERQWVQWIADRYKKQYCVRGKWKNYVSSEMTSEGFYTVLRELRTLKAVEALLNPSWTRYPRRMLGLPRAE